MTERHWELKGPDLETFEAVDGPTRTLILRLLDEPTDADFTAPDNSPNSVMLATWLGELPAYRGGYDDDSEDPGRSTEGDRDQFRTSRDKS